MYDYMNRARPLSGITTLVSLIFLIILWELSPGLNRNGGQRKSVCVDSSLKNAGAVFIYRERAL